eukprot:c4026_g1_i1.p1 GENE.c4026_g1_i1~~c4026_g1_i1.p1  ORF type:complete len:187 (-),score=32.74 c4026_g1_i1:160-720(-)
MNDAARIGFCVVGAFAAFIILVGTIVDGSFAALGHSFDTCFPFTNTSMSQGLCCTFMSGNFTGNPNDRNMCTSKTTASHPSCLCCRYSDQTTMQWDIKGTCSEIPHRLSGTLGASSAFNLLSGLVLTASLFIACCRCCGQPRFIQSTVVARASDSTPGSSHPHFTGSHSANDVVVATAVGSTRPVM